MGLSAGARRATIAVLLAGVGLIGVEGWRVLTPTSVLDAGPLVVDVPAAERTVAIARHLEAAGAIRSHLGFLTLTLVRGSFRSLKAGEYEIPRGTATPGVLALLESGKVRQHALLHPEGATVAELARALERAGLGEAPAILQAAHDPALLHALGIEGPSVEGYLFPDTYYLVRGMTPAQILTRMVQHLRAKLTPDMVARARARGLTVHALLTLASIVEREAVVHEERPLIAAVFWNRLRLGMPLQADPTVQYAVGKERRTLTRSDLQSDDPYNTYVRPGLPPGPIASPGLDAILATLDPAPVPYLYFVALDDHHHHFSTTLEEHQRAVARYRQRRNGAAATSHEPVSAMRGRRPAPML